jgi:hypothetical protein
MARGRYPIGSGDNDDLHARCGCEVANFRADDLSFAYANLTRTASSPQRIPGRTVASPSSPGPPQRQVRPGIISQVKFFLSAGMGSLRWGCQIGKFDFFTPPRDIRSERPPKIALVQETALTIVHQGNEHQSRDDLRRRETYCFRVHNPEPSRDVTYRTIIYGVKQRKEGCPVPVAWGEAPHPLVLCCCAVLCMMQSDPQRQQTPNRMARR